MPRNLIQLVKPVAKGSSRSKHRNRITLRDPPITKNGKSRNGTRNGNKTPNVKNEASPNVRNNRRKPNAKKAPNGKRKRNTIEKILSINSHTGKRTLVQTNLLDKHTNSKKSSLRRPLRHPPNRMAVQVKHSMLRKTHKGLAEKTVRNRGNGEGSKVLKGKATLLFRD